MVIQITDCKIVRDGNCVLDTFSCNIPAGVFGAVVGPNGAGKSSLIRSMVGLLPIQEDAIRFDDQPFHSVRHLVAYVGQKISVDLYFPTTVYEVVSMGRFVHKRWWEFMSAIDHQAVMDALLKVDLVFAVHKRLYELSGGQQQRVFVARALAQNPEVYLMDEPFVGVDKKTELMIVEILQNECLMGKTALIVHHDFATLQRYFNWAMFINKRLIAADYFDRMPIDMVISQTCAIGCV